MLFRYLFISAGCLLFLLLLAIAVRQFKERQSLRVVLLTVESLRDVQVNEANTPNLLAATGQGAVRFTGHRAISGWTATNIVTLLTGISPFASGVHTRGQSLPENLNPPLKQLGERGYLIEGLQPFMTMDIYQNLGLDVDRRGPEPTLWLAEQRRDGGPFFLWYHYVNTHLPYGPEPLPEHWPREVRARMEKVRTQASILHDEARFSPEDVSLVQSLQAKRITEFDQWFGEFWGFWQRAGLGRDTILIVTADHGDEHGQRGMVGHASTTLAGHLHEEVVRVPLFIWLPESLTYLADQIDSAAATSHVDIMPTLLARLGIKAALPLEGRDLFATPPQEQRRTARPAPPEGNGCSWLAMTASGGFAEPDPEHIRYFEYACLKDGWKSRLRIHAGGEEQFFLYHLENDPGESINLATDQPRIADLHRHLLQKAIAQRVKVPVRPSARDDHSRVDGEDGGPETALQWLHPTRSGPYSYADLKGEFRLQWSGAADREYIIDYRAGHGRKALAGTLAVRGSSKDFGTIDNRYWLTWIVPNSPFRLRVRQADGPDSSPWLELEARP
jgi:choline-sulfatase